MIGQQGRHGVADELIRVRRGDAPLPIGRRQDELVVIREGLDPGALPDGQAALLQAVRELGAVLAAVLGAQTPVLDVPMVLGADGGTDAVQIDLGLSLAVPPHVLRLGVLPLADILREGRL